MATAKELAPQLEAAQAKIAELEASLAEAGGEGSALPPAIDEPPAAHVIEAIARVKRDLPGIGKGDRSEGVPYAFRGIETLTSHLQGLTARHGVVIVQQSAIELPSGYEYNSSTNRVWHETHVHYGWAVFGPGGINDVIYGESIGYGRDDQDKGASKASTQAFKEFLVKLFCIGDKANDGDTHTTEPQTTNGEPAGRTFGTGEPPKGERALIDWHALGWAPEPIPDTPEGTKLAATARQLFEECMKAVKMELDKLPEDVRTTLVADRKKIIGELPFTVAQVRTWEGMVDAALREHVDGDDNDEVIDGVLQEQFPGSEEVPTDVNQDPA